MLREAQSNSSDFLLVNSIEAPAAKQYRIRCFVLMPLCCHNKRPVKSPTVKQLELYSISDALVYEVNCGETSSVNLIAMVLIATIKFADSGFFLLQFFSFSVFICVVGFC